MSFQIGSPFADFAIDVNSIPQIAVLLTFAIDRTRKKGFNLLNCDMQIAAEFSYRYAGEIMQEVAPQELQDIENVLNDRRNILSANTGRAQRNYSARIKHWFLTVLLLVLAGP